MKSLKKLLVKRSKIHRNRRVLLNIHIQVLAWLMEVLPCLVAIFMCFIPFERVATIVSSHVAGIGYAIFVPAVYLNNDDLKNSILENKWYLAFTNKFFSNTINKIIPADDETEQND